MKPLIRPYNEDIMYNTIRLIKEAVGVPYEYIEDADQCKTAIAAIYGILRAAEAMEEVKEAHQEKHGRWSEDWLPSTGGGSYQVWRCSECESAFNWRMKYCGHCGAKMDEVEK